MSSTVIDRARPAGHRAPHRGSGFTGTLGLLRLYLRRDRVSLPLWVLLLSVPLATVYIASVETVYPDRSARAAAAAASTCFQTRIAGFYGGCAQRHSSGG